MQWQNDIINQTVGQKNGQISLRHYIDSESVFARILDFHIFFAVTSKTFVSEQSIAFTRSFFTASIDINIAQVLQVDLFLSRSSFTSSLGCVNEPDKFFVCSPKVQEHSLTINSNLFFPVVKLPLTRLTSNTTIDLSLTTNNLNTMQ